MITAAHVIEQANRLSVRWKILGPVGLTAAVLIALSTYMTLTAFDDRVQSDIESRAQLMLGSISHAAEIIEDAAELNDFVGTLGAEPEIEMIAVVDAQKGVVVASTRDGWIGQRLDRLSDPAILAQVERIKKDEPGPAFAELDSHVWEFARGVEKMHRPAGARDGPGVVVVRLDTREFFADSLGLAWRLASWQTLAALFALSLIAYVAYEFIIKRLDFLRTLLEAHENGEDLDIVGNRRDEFGKLAEALVGMFRAMRESEARLANLAQRDSLTGLANRSLFKERLNHDLSLAERTGGIVGLMLLDLDNFKDVNDTLGHDVGDHLLQRTADVLRECARRSDTVARLGGDEFAIILSDVDNAASVTRLANRIIQALSRPQRIGSHEIHPGTSIGITIYPQDGREPDVLLKNADLALYRAKAEGRGNFQLYRHELHLRAMERNAIERDLRNALTEEQFTLHYQPKVDLRTGLVTGAEALVRWNHPERGIIPPNMFIPVAESNGFIVELTRWVLEEACRQNRIWQADGLPTISIAVNVSAIDLRRSDLTDHVASTLIRSGLSPQHLELEVTESMVMRDVDFVIGTLRRLRSLGVGIAIDDFGTGYCSLAYLKRFPVKRLKIDRSFVRDMLEVRDGYAIPKVIIDLARSLGVRVVAEGVETAQQVDALQRLGCDEAQGYYLGRPAPAEEFAEFLRHYRVPFETPDTSEPQADSDAPSKAAHTA